MTGRSTTPRRFVIIAALIAAGMLPTAPPAGAAAGWSVATSPPSPPGPPVVLMTGLSCVTDSSCFAVGWYSNADGVPRTLIERWNGQTWTIVPSPNAPGWNYLAGVSCATATRCFAVGQSNNAGASNPLVEQWNGTAWTLVPVPIPAGTTSRRLSAVSCTSTTNCFAVGNAETSGGPRTMVERWDGTGWTVVPSATPAAATRSSLLGVSCVSTSVCFAVGRYMVSGVFRTLIERWNGSVWTISPSPNPSVDYDALAGVSCASTFSCFAVGEADGPLVERWNGTSWSVSPSPNVGTLRAVSCPTASACFAVGGGADAFAQVQRWNGSTWSVATVAEPSGAIGSVFGAVDCTSPTSCFAVGDYGGVDQRTLAERWDGTAWAVLPSPSPPGPSRPQLGGVSCASATFCVAVGTYIAADSIGHALIERWNGTGWQVDTGPNPPAGASVGLSAVSCPNATTCFAAGIVVAANGYRRAVIERWNGTTWTFVSNPTPANGSNGLTAVSCATATSCFAVGTYPAASGPRSLFLRWNGSTWTQVAGDDPAAQYLDLVGVSCASATSCFAVGHYGDGSSNAPLIERWDGANWTIVASPTPVGASSVLLAGISCVTSTSCFAVGSSFDPSGASALAERWDGSSWTFVANPDPSAVYLRGVSCRSTMDCFTVGVDLKQAPPRTRIEHWNGTGWATVPSADPPGAIDVDLASVSCGTSTSCFAVGSFTRLDPRRVLIEQS